MYKPPNKTMLMDNKNFKANKWLATPLVLQSSLDDGSHCICQEHAEIFLIAHPWQKTFPADPSKTYAFDKKLKNGDHVR